MAKRSSILVTLALATLGSCGSGPALPVSDGPAAPVLVLGVDGMEWGLALPLLAAGELPNLAGLIERGSIAAPSTLIPTWSPRIWTSVATGKEPEVHGIENFVRYDDQRKPVALYTQEDRRTKAHWNMLSDAGVRVDTIGWWMTFPVEPVDGLMVAQTNTSVAEDPERAGPQKGVLREGVPAQVWPAAREADVFERFAAVEVDLDATIERIFGVLEPYSEESAQRWEDCRWAFRADSTYLDLALSQAARPEGPADVTAVYLGGTDVVGHRFFAAHRPGPFRLEPDHDEVRVFGDVIPDYYRFVDEAIGRLLEAWPEETTLLLVTDHGMVSQHRDALRRGLFVERDGRYGISNSGGHPQGDRGMMVLAGTGVRAGAGRPASLPLAELTREQISDYGSVLDIAPSLLALCGLPAGEDMPGQVMEELLTVEVPARIPTWDDESWLVSRVRTGIQPVGTDTRIEQLDNLGYLGDD